MKTTIEGVVLHDWKTYIGDWLARSVCHGNYHRLFPVNFDILNIAILSKELNYLEIVVTYNPENMNGEGAKLYIDYSGSYSILGFESEE